ncbi:MAG TPA: hypothetical protein VFO34_03435 [Candidatus Acidoferrales bacterium]|nr:hypothetical protein [Candidatus Acidoferrales bacterium]
MKLAWNRNGAAAGWSAIWALALIAGAFLFKHSSQFYWIESAIFVGAITHILWRTEQRGGCC